MIAHRAGVAPRGAADAVPLAALLPTGRALAEGFVVGDFADFLAAFLAGIRFVSQMPADRAIFTTFYGELQELHRIGIISQHPTFQILAEAGEYLHCFDRSKAT